MRAYLERQWGKILAGRVSVQDFIVAKEVGGAGGATSVGVARAALPCLLLLYRVGSGK